MRSERRNGPRQEEGDASKGISPARLHPDFRAVVAGKSLDLISTAHAHAALEFGSGRLLNTSRSKQKRLFDTSRGDLARSFHQELIAPREL